MSDQRVERHNVIDWLGPTATDATDEQITAIQVAWQDYYDSTPVRERDGEPADWADEDRAVTSATARHILGDDLELTRLGRELTRARGVLYLTVVGAVHAGMPEAQAAREAGIDRMTVRRLLGKR